MAHSAYNYDLPRESTSGPAGPDSQPGQVSGPVGSQEALGGLPVLNVSGDPRAMPQGRLRHRGGQYRRDGMGGVESISMTYMPDVRDASVLHSPVPRPQPQAADWSQGGYSGPTVYGSKHLCDGDSRCTYWCTAQFRAEIKAQA
jgi:hypothetical protein